MPFNASDKHKQLKESKVSWKINNNCAPVCVKSEYCSYSDGRHSILTEEFKSRIREELEKVKSNPNEDPFILAYKRRVDEIIKGESETKISKLLNCSFNVLLRLALIAFLWNIAHVGQLAN